jgi:hypothetical protein
MASFTPQANAEKALKELQKLPANKRCADCSGNGSLVRAGRALLPKLGATGPPRAGAHCGLRSPAGAAVRLRQLRHLHLPQLRCSSVRASLCFLAQP